MFLVPIVFISFNSLIYSTLIDKFSTQTQTRRKHDGEMLDLVMSDEFNVGGREFGPGDDFIFEAIDKPDYTNEAMQFCKLFQKHANISVFLAATWL